MSNCDYINVHDDTTVSCFRLVGLARDLNQALCQIKYLYGYAFVMTWFIYHSH